MLLVSYGIILIGGYLAGVLIEKIGLPKVTGYLVVGILLNPQVTSILPEGFSDHTDFITNLSLAFITFSVGGTLKMKTMKKAGKMILTMTFFEAEFAFLLVWAGFSLIFPLISPDPALNQYAVPIGLLLGALACPTDPSATLAVKHEYNAQGEVSSTILGIAAFDDIMGLLNYSIFVTLAVSLMAGQAFSLGSAIVAPLISIGGAILLGFTAGMIFNLIPSLLKKVTDGVLILLVFGFLMLVFGVSDILGIDELLATMVMGVAIVNFNKHEERIFNLLTAYTEEFIFVLFFVLSSVHLNFSVIADSYWLIIVFVIFRALGKFSGTFGATMLVKTSPHVRKYTAFGLLPQGGIVIGLALMIKQNDAFSGIADIIISVVIGATIIHEILGPILARIVLKKAGEIN